MIGKGLATRRYPQYRGHKIEILNHHEISVNASNIGEVYHSYPETFLKQYETLKYMHNYGKFRVNPRISAELKKRKHYSYKCDYYSKRRQGKAYYFQINLAVRYATWLNVDFGVWLFDQIDDIISERRDPWYTCVCDWERYIYY